LAFSMKAAATPYNPQAVTQQAATTPVVVQQQEGESGIKEVVIYGSIGLIVAGGAIWLGRKFIQNLLSTSEERKAVDEDSAAAFAKRIKMAFDNDGWPGTDKSMLRDAMRQIPSKTVFQQVVSSYQKLYNDSLLKNLSDELTSTEYNEMMQIVAGKPDKITKGAKALLNYTAWARRLKAAFDKTYGFIPGTDEAAIKAVFLEIPTHDAFIQTGKAYARDYGKNIIDELKSELSSSDYTELMRIIVRKPQR
jgi:hypothetical protein